MILAIETATNVCSVAFYDKEGDLAEKRVEERGSHSEQLFLFIEELMEEHDFSIADLSAVLVSEGPGSYTGLRIGASAVKGLLFGTEVPLYGVNTLAAFAMGTVSPEEPDVRIHSVIDARRVHLYHQQFTVSENGLEAEDEIEVLPIEAVEAMIQEGDILIGTGLERINENFRKKTDIFGLEAISARSLVTLYQAGYEHFFRRADVQSFEPEYYTSNQVK